MINNSYILDKLQLCPQCLKIIDAEKKIVNPFKFITNTEKWFY